VRQGVSIQRHRSGGGPKDGCGSAGGGGGGEEEGHGGGRRGGALGVVSELIQPLVGNADMNCRTAINQFKKHGPRLGEDYCAGDKDHRETYGAEEGGGTTGARGARGGPGPAHAVAALDACERGTATARVTFQKNGLIAKKPRENGNGTIASAHQPIMRVGDHHHEAHINPHITPGGVRGGGGDPQTGTGWHGTGRRRGIEKAVAGAEERWQQ